MQENLFSNTIDYFLLLFRTLLENSSWSGQSRWFFSKRPAKSRSSSNIRLVRSTSSSNKSWARTPTPTIFLRRPPLPATLRPLIPTYSRASTPTKVFTRTPLLQMWMPLLVQTPPPSPAQMFCWQQPTISTVVLAAAVSTLSLAPGEAFIICLVALQINIF